MRGFSKAIVAGNVTRDPELRSTSAGTSVCSFGIAVNRQYKDSSGNNQESVSYIDCVVWGKLTETFVKYVKKGNPLLVSGRLEQRSWEDKQTGQKRSRTEVIVEDFSFLGGGRSDAMGAMSAPAAPKKTGSKDAAPADVAPEDIPMDGQEVNLDEIPF